MLVMVGVLGCRFGGGGWVMGLPVLWWWQWVVCWWMGLCCGFVVLAVAMAMAVAVGVALGLGLGWGGRMGLGWGVCGVLGLGYGVAGVVVVAVGGLLVETLFSLSSSQSLLAGIKTFRSSPWVANVDVVCGGQSGRWVLRRRRCLGWGLVDAVVWGLRIGIWVAPPPTVKWVWALGFGFLRRQNGFGRWDVEVCFC
uniref:Transmembrane protein n=1 Tax=Fagus sylvatica TaxID=28930 RepID=A0A2N9G1L9_FAGSY